MRRILVSLALLAVTAGLWAQKRIYIPLDLRGHDFSCDTVRWCWRHSAQTDNLVFFWEQGFGHDLSCPPPLDGHSMKVDLPNLMERVEHFYRYFRDTLQFTRPGSKADSLKMMVMLNYSLEGTAYGGTYDDHIGALWVAPNRIQDRKLNCLAHELGHSFQSQIMADGAGEAWGGSGFFEMTSQWMLWLVNPDWLTDENYHFEAFKRLTHKAYLHMENIYHSPYVIAYWAEQHGLPSIAELYRQGRRGEDPVMTYKRLYAMNQAQFCDDMFRCCQGMINLDYRHARRETRRYACTWSTPLDTLDGNWLAPKECMPEEYGFNAIRLPARDAVSVRFVGGRHRYGFVGVTSEGESVYSPIYSKPASTVRFRAPKGKTWSHLYFVVMGAPEEHAMLRHDVEAQTYPYRFHVN